VRARPLVPVAALALAAGFSGCGSDAAARIPLGRQVYVRECSRCHLLGGRGYPGVYPNLAGNPIVTLNSPEPMIEIVTRGRGGMPAFGGQLPDQKVAAVISYVRQAWGNDASAVSPAQVK
jgi:mono/diheme cytochrome c family protein